ncbi:cytidylyltransferase domain-containing protein [Lysinibacillus xylanilyticus]|uniref:Acylneuraminate cytidylyltransferase family protein n=1 Tax=Lysinibacillus xylanilyticus TaxID=582475 RepID=A0ABT4EM84_9BACI|nr:acylneuraminate cytidylyltransferase family protein [Lysinibacillus xylanilyticus]MCY9546108.1 acylneuraminate cytidylyltransferase family protein [Lysinibacillus xylanilyticus]
MKPKVLAIIPARGGSKGVPRKNIKELAGKPLIEWTIEEAKKSKYIDRIIVSSEDKEILQVAQKFGADVPFVRPANLAEDTTAGIEPVLHALEHFSDYEYVVMLQPTSPLRLVEDIDGCIEQLLQENAEFCVSVCEVGQSPYWMYTLDSSTKMQPLLKQQTLITRRQDLPKVYTLNGAIYLANIDLLKQTRNFITEETIAYVMPVERSYDIDTEEDFKICEYRYTNL